MGFGPGPIPWTAIQQYATVQELSQDQTEALHFHIGRMDNTFLEWSNKKTDSKTKGK